MKELILDGNKINIEILDELKNVGLEALKVMDELDQNRTELEYAFKNGHVTAEKIATELGMTPNDLIHKLKGNLFSAHDILKFMQALKKQIKQ